ncbi:MAG: ATP-dependent DNA helicase RecG [Candidatus Marinimicrobia bacterium]|nr:ATP-dependent DNA helicase RecG [Candidatus Neomarinimicrobiota bacterium]
MYNDLQIPVVNLPMIGIRRQQALAGVGIHTLEDLLYYVPRNYLDRSSVKAIGHLVVGESCTVIGEVLRVKLMQAHRRKIFKVEISDTSGLLTLNWFHGIEWISKAFKPGDTVSVFGKVDFYNGLVMTHPDYDFIDQKRDTLNTGAVIPVYPLTQELRRSGFSSRSFRKLFASVLDLLPPDIPHGIPESLRREQGFMSFSEAIRQLHFPGSAETLQSALRRFKFEEFFMLQLLMAIRKQKLQREKNSAPCSKAGDIVHRLYHQLPFEPTGAQKRVVKEIYADLRGEVPMNRLLQGDVGSGKTLVAAMCAAIMTANGYQTAIMAPTEILAEQHARHFRREFERLGVESCLITGKTPRKQRETMLEGIVLGKIPIVIGTHALISDDVRFHALGLVVIDEQHRFGVEQRGSLIGKAAQPHVLAMTATPIPRTLSMALYGDMDVSLIDEMPRGRKPVRTKVVEPGRLEQVYRFLEKEMQAGRQVYVVYPLISESEKMDLQALEQGFSDLSRRFSEYRPEMLHGKTKKEEKLRIMQDFMEGRSKMLVSTTVIEVGIDNPRASVMLIENAERFGLSQLHQLRGRVGRGTEASWCILIRRSDADIALERLQVLEKNNNGFRIAEEDLRQRGQGEMFGVRQHGLPEFRFVDMYTDRPLLETARKAAFDLIKSDPHLLKTEHRDLRAYFLRHYKDKLRHAGIS